MNEKLLQYLWNFRIFRNFDFQDTEGNPLEILDFGEWNFNSGPDFLTGKIQHNGFVHAGNIELHVKSSDYIFHKHTGNPEFNNLILHVVFEHDLEIEELTLRNVPTLELKKFIDPEIQSRYRIFAEKPSFIPCENNISKNDVPFGFFEEAMLRKLDQKANSIAEILQYTKNNYEQALFILLSHTFGLKVNAEIFKLLAERIDFSVFRKIRQNITQTEALFFGLCGFLEDAEDSRTREWKREFNFLQSKFKLMETGVTPKFSRLRPASFPTIRLSQLAVLYHQNPHLWSQIISSDNVDEMRRIFRKVKATEYWDNHFVFGKKSPVENEKILSEDFIDIILLNAVLPLKYAYYRNHDEEITDKVLELYSQIGSEKNVVISQWKKLGIAPKNALESQGLLHHYRNFCTAKKCLNCSIGYQLMKVKNEGA